MAKFCSTCGRPLTGSEKFCSSCGSAIKNEIQKSFVAPETQKKDPEIVDSTIENTNTVPIEDGQHLFKASQRESDRPLFQSDFSKPIKQTQQAKTNFSAKPINAQKPRSEPKSRKKISSVARYFFGVIFILSGLISINQISGLIFIFLGISLTPLVYIPLKKKFGEDPSKTKLLKLVPIITPIVFMLLIGMFPPSDPITNVEIQNAVVTVAIGDTATITVITDPIDYDIKKLAWESSDESIATIKDGVIIGLSEGDVTIKVLGSKNIMDSIVVHIRYVDVSSVTLQGPTSVIVGKTGSLTADYFPLNATEKKVVWESSNPSVISVDQNGVMSAMSKGSTTITATTKNGVSSSVVVSTYYEVASITLGIETLSLERLKTAILTVSILPVEAKDNLLTWTSSDPSVASVENGKITAVKTGTVTVSATAVNGVKANITVTVTEVLADSISLNYITYDLKVGNSLLLKATVLPSNTTVKSVVWTSSNSNVISVSNGIVTAHTYGIATITATSSNGKVATCEFFVKQLSPVTLLNWHYTSDMFGGIEWNFRIKNNTSKKINYVVIQWYNFNSVGDLVYDYIDGKNYTRLKYTGPLAAGATSSYKRNTTLFYSYSYDSSTISEIIVEYSDGTTQTIGLSDIEYYYNVTK